MVNENTIKDAIAQELGIAGMNAQSQNTVIEKLTAVLLKKLIVDIAEKIPREKREEFETISAENNQEKMRLFLALYIPDLDIFLKNKLQEGIAEFKRLQTA